MDNNTDLEDETGVSPTEHEYNCASRLNLDCLAFIKGDSSVQRHPKESALLINIQNQLSYKRFELVDQLITEVTKACITLLKHMGLIRFTAFDESLNERATLNDIEPDKIDTFIGIARAKEVFHCVKVLDKEGFIAHEYAVWRKIDQQCTAGVLKQPATIFSLLPS